MLAKVCFIALCTLALATASQMMDQDEQLVEASVQPSARFFAIQATTTRVKIETTIVTSTVKSLCASLVNVTGACRRRRRGIEDRPIVLSFDDDEDIDIYNPAPVQPMEATVAPFLSRSALAKDALQSSQPEPVEVDIIGLQSDCAPRRFMFGANNLVSGLVNAYSSLTLLFTSQLTATLTIVKTVTSGAKPFVVQGCTPNPFVYPVC